jgi:Cd2+/Zn2+-exporting ATPase
MGISGTIDGKPVCTGRSEWILTQCTSGTLNGFAEDTSGSYLYVVIEGKHKGTIQFLDVIKSDASSTIRTLRNCPDSEIIMITGDRTEVAEKIALHLGCAFKAEMLPKHKMDCINDAKSKGHFVAMIGDGINDAPALAAGDVSIAMGGTGSDVAIHSASIVIMNDKLDRIPFVFDLSRKTVKIIRQNLAFSISFIVLMVGLSATGVISPVLAAILHSFSTVTVIFNSARLLKEGENIT